METPLQIPTPLHSKLHSTPRLHSMTPLHKLHDALSHGHADNANADADARTMTLAPGSPNIRPDSLVIICTILHAMKS